MRAGTLLAIAASIGLAVAASAAVFTPSPGTDLQGIVNAANGSADPENTIILAPGTYPATYQVQVTKTLTIVGAGAGATTIVPTADTGSSGDGSGWFLISPGIMFKLMDVTVDGNGFTIYDAIRSYAKTLVQGCTFIHIGRYEPPGPSGFYYGRAVRVEDNDLTVNNCAFSEIGRIHAYVYGPGSSENLVTGSTFVGKGTGDWLDYAVEVEGGAFCEVTHNRISNCGSSTTAWASAGVLATTYFGAGTSLQADYNLFICNQIAVAVGYPPDTSQAEAHSNTFLGNGCAIANWSSNTVPAEENWWGATDGPGGGGPGSGDTIWSSTGAGAITYDPWLMAPINQFGMPVDLNGTYLTGSKDPSLTYAGYISVTTDPAGGLYGHKVLEYSYGQWAQDATYSPFSDDVKPPSSLLVGLRGHGFTFDVDMHELSRWVDSVTYIDNEYFEVGAGSNLNGDDGRPAVWVLCWKNAGAFRIELQTTSGVGGPFYAAATDESRFHVEAWVNAANTQMWATVTPLNGAGAGVPHTIGPLPLSLPEDDVSNIGFFVGSPSYAEKSIAKATVSSFNTNAAPNALYLFADDPYVTTSEAIDYRLGMAGLTAYVAGFQAFLSNPSENVQGPLSSRTYSTSPFPLHILPEGLQTDGGVDYTAPHGQDGLLLDATLAHFRFASLAAQGAAGLVIEPDNGAGAPTRFSDCTGVEVAPTRLNSNTVVVDDTPPTLSDLTAVQAAGDVIGGIAIQGPLSISVKAYDNANGSIGSGLADRPTIKITWSNGTSTALETVSGPDNEFRAECAIGPFTPCGPATVSVTASDNAGNAPTPLLGNFTVNVSQVAVAVELAGVQLPVGTSITRGIRFVLGGTGGSHPAIILCKNVAFSDPDGDGIGQVQPACGIAALTALDVLPGGWIPCGATVSLISAKDTLHTLTKTLPAAGGPSYTASFTGANALKGGDAGNDDLVDILDFGMFAMQWDRNLGANTPCGTPPPHTDFSGNGHVGTSDYTFIQVNFLMVGDDEPGAYGPRRIGKTRATVQEMLDAGIKVAREFDLDNDGWVTVDEIARWLADRPGDAVSRRN